MGIFSDAIISLLATLAKQERIRLSERTRAGMARVRKQGIVKLGRPRTPESTITSMVEMKKLGLPLTIIGQKHNVSASRVSQLITQWNQQKEGEHAESSSEVQIA
jgi:putative DNA-invertase from lambdoid prophage Rac